MSSARQKAFDAVQLMRSVRDEISRETQDMTVAEELRWLESTQFDDPTLARLAQRAAQQRAGAAGASRHR